MELKFFGSRYLPTDVSHEKVNARLYKQDLIDRFILSLVYNTHSLPISDMLCKS